MIPDHEKVEGKNLLYLYSKSMHRTTVNLGPLLFVQCTLTDIRLISVLHWLEGIIYFLNKLL